MNNWGPYWDGYDTLCSYHESYPIALTLFLNGFFFFFFFSFDFFLIEKKTV